MAYRIRPEDRALIEAFRRRPLGPHDPRLQRVLNTLRSGPMEGRYVLVCTKPFREYVLARHPGRRGRPLELLHDHVYASPEEAEWAAFRLRWKAHTGEDVA